MEQPKTLSTNDQALFNFFMSAPVKPQPASIPHVKVAPPPTPGPAASVSLPIFGGNNNNAPAPLAYTPLPSPIQVTAPMVTPNIFVAPTFTPPPNAFAPQQQQPMPMINTRAPLGNRPKIQQGQVGSVNMQQLGAPVGQYVPDSTTSNNDMVLSMIPGTANFMQDVDLSGLSPGQEAAIRAVLSGKNILLTGSAGAGKSWTLKRLKDIYEKKRLNIGITSTTGASAILIEGSTIHAFAGIGICSTKESALKQVQTRKAPQQRIITTSLLIIDEVSMMSDIVLDILDHVFRVVRNNNKAFGGMQVVLCGDFFQLKPVKCDTFAFQSQNWPHLINEVHELTYIFRQESAVFCKALNEVRVGEVSLETMKLFESCIGRQFTGDIKPTELYSVNEDVDRLNEDELWKLVTEANPVRQIDALDQIIERPKSRFPPTEKFLKECKERLNKDCMAPEFLQLCVGAQVMLIKNLNVAAGLGNGSRCVVIGFGNQGQPIVKFLNGHEMIMQTAVWSMRVSETARIQRTQFPLKMAFAITTHRAQGCTLDLARVDLGSRLFCSGQFYTACSRIKSIEGLSIVSIDWTKLLVDPKVKEFYAKHRALRRT
jgi:ATP-dependent DNA helicase PIF1